MSLPRAGRILVDTGPFVAIFDDEDAHHQACVQVLEGLDGPLYTCWPVITEAAWLLRHSPRAVQRLLGSINTDFVELLSLVGSEAEAVGALMTRYESIRPQLADIALVYLAARDGIDTIFTLDHRDFSIYRASRRRSFHIIPEM